MKSPNTTSKAKTSRRKPAKRGKLPKSAKPGDYPDLQDIFARCTEQKTRTHLVREHMEKMQALEQLHQAQMRSIREQLQITLFEIWNQMWLQKKASHAKAHKEWLKVLAA